MANSGRRWSNTFALAAYHHAVAVLEAPDAAGGADVHEVEVMLMQHLGTGDGVAEVGVTTVNEDIAGAEERGSGSGFAGW